ncbi:MAG TPA: multidrug effflux MFS transporter [Patescibacteria group bacterium]|nr:multidrug effflux MFS transporter [Gammaproteobacteria bacterium]HWA51505.1 multidrug effflux MFS transporter [Patescibacteria group bacterium]
MKSAIFITLSIAMGMLCLLPSDIYLPALPLIQQYFDSSTSLIQMTLSVFLLGTAASQFLIGPFVDFYNLKAIGIVSVTIFLIATLICAITTSIEVMIIARFFQACGAGFAAVISRAAVTKNYDSQKAAHVYLIMSPILAVSPAIAPVIGGNLSKFLGWRSVFIFIFILGILILIGIWKFFAVKQTSSPAKEDLHPFKIIKNYLDILRNKCFSGYLLTRCAVDASYFAYITASPFIFHTLGYSTIQIGNFYIIPIISFVGAAYLTKRLMDKYSKDLLMLIGLLISIFGGIVLYLIGITHYYYALQIILPAAIMTAGYGFTGSLSWTEAMAQFPASQSGSVSSLIGFFPLIAASLAAALVNILTHGSVSRLAIFMVILLSLATLILLKVIRFKTEKKQLKMNSDPYN